MSEEEIAEAGKVEEREPEELKTSTEEKTQMDPELLIEPTTSSICSEKCTTTQRTTIRISSSKDKNKSGCDRKKNKRKLAFLYCFSCVSSDE